MPPSRPRSLLESVETGEQVGKTDSRAAPSLAATEQTPLMSAPESSASSLRRTYDPELDAQSHARASSGGAKSGGGGGAGAGDGPQRGESDRTLNPTDLTPAAVVRQQSKTLKLARKIKRRSKYYIPVSA